MINLNLLENFQTCLHCSKNFILDEVLLKRGRMGKNICQECRMILLRRVSREYRKRHSEKLRAKDRLRRTGDSRLKINRRNLNAKSKICSICKTDKPLETFGKDSRVIDQRTSTCLECISTRERNWLSDPEKGDKIRKKQRERTKKLRKIPKYSLDYKMSGAIYSALKKVKASKGGKSWKELVDYTPQDLKNHIESLFTEGMTWEKFCNGEIHLDHKIPKSWFKYESPNDPEFKKCWALENLQPLWAKDNLKKHNRFAHL